MAESSRAPVVPAPLVVAIEMGYGHLRPAHALAGVLEVPVLEADRAPLAGPEEQRLWARARSLYEGLTRLSQVPVAGPPLRRIVETLTAIPHLHPYRDLSAPTAGASALAWFGRLGMGRGLVDHMQATGAPLLATFFAPAVLADARGAERVYCVVTDSDVNRIWAPRSPDASRVHYFAPSRRVVRRLTAYGVSPDNVSYTGFPLPHELVGGREQVVLKRNLAARLHRLDPHRAFLDSHHLEVESRLGLVPEGPRAPAHVVFAVGGAGAQAGLAREFLPSFREPLRRGLLRLTLVAGIRAEVAASFRAALAEAGIAADAVDILLEPNHAAYFRSFNRLLADTDVLWSKPSEITFFAALGLPLVFSWPVGVHEAYNRRWALEAGAGLKQRDPAHAGEWLLDWISDGTLAAAAWSGWRRLPSLGTYEIVERVRAP